MGGLYIRQTGQKPFRMEKNEVVPAIKSRMLSAADEISADGRNWIPIGTHKQLGTLFKTRTTAATPTPSATAAPASPAASPPKPRKMSLQEFYSSERVFCPKCGFEQDRGASCQKCEVIFDKYWESKTGGNRKKAEPVTTPQSSSTSSGNFLKTLWNGEYPLWMTFWVFGVAIPMAIWFLFQTFLFAPTMENMMTRNPSREEMIEMMRGNFRSIIILTLIMYVYQFIVSVGLWRSAHAYDGFGLWRVLVQILVVLFFISIPGTIYSYFNAWNQMEQGLQQMDMMMQMQQNQMQQNTLPPP